MIWENSTFRQLSQLNRDTLVLVPVGTIEAHGGHLPLSTDTLIPQRLCQQISKHIKSIIAPEINFGVCDSMLSFPGTINIQPRTMSILLSNYLDSIIGYGFKTIYILNGHGGNELVLANLVKKYSKKVKIKSKSWYDFNYIHQLKKTNSDYLGDHADRLETEMVLHSNPELVNLKKATDDYFTWPSDEPDDYSFIMPNAVYGYPSRSNSASAAKNFKKITDLLVDDIRLFVSQK